MIADLAICATTFEIDFSINKNYFEDSVCVQTVCSGTGSILRNGD